MAVVARLDDLRAAEERVAPVALWRVQLPVLVLSQLRLGHRHTLACGESESGKPHGR